ncbi:MAG TPA: SDR family oxidoreductase, partial [Terriglobia bacterium]|nr:SDR family oxidoreductase [Terriglobia bacterium]
HVDFPQFSDWLQSRIQIFRGDITGARLGLNETDYRQLTRSTDSMIHCAASLNRKSEKSCLNVNLRGTLEVLQLVRRAVADHGMRRFSHISTVAVAGQRSNETVQEDRAIEWDRSDYDPYARTKKFCEHMIREILPDVPITIFRPSIIMGDSRHPQTTQFDMVQAFVFLARLRILPLRPDARLDIVSSDFVAESIVALHRKEKPLFDTYHLSSGEMSLTCRQVTDTLSKARGQWGPLYLPGLAGSFRGLVSWLANRRGTTIGHLASLMKAFLPYLLWNTIFDNRRVIQETGKRPAPFTDYCFPLFRFAMENKFSFPYQDWPQSGGRAIQ